MRRWLKNILNVTFCLIPIGIVIGFSTNWSHRTPISCVGSSGVKPFIESLATDYLREDKKVDVTVEAGGSGFGIEQIAKGYTNIGDTSKDPYSMVKGSTDLRHEWSSRKIKTVTFGWEAICVVYIPPKGLNLTHEQLRNALTVTGYSNSTERGNIGDLMRVFSGYKDMGAGENWNDSLNKMSVFTNAKANLPEKVKTAFANQTITPYVRTGGALVSGTADSFYRETHLFNVNSPEENQLTQRQKNAFIQGNYGHELNVITTDEANSRAWDMFTKQNIPGSMVYLSSGFVEQNLKLIDKNGYGIMAYKNVPYDIKVVDNASDGYNWLRPLNTMISLLPQDAAEQDFIKYLIMLSNNKEGQDKLSKIGAKYLTTGELSSMKIFIDDFKLEDDCTIIKNQWDDGEIQYFGAEPLMAD